MQTWAQADTGAGELSFCSSEVQAWCRLGLATFAYISRCLCMHYLLARHSGPASFALECYRGLGLTFVYKCHLLKTLTPIT